MTSNKQDMQKLPYIWSYIFFFKSAFFNFQELERILVIRNYVPVYFWPKADYQQVFVIFTTVRYITALCQMLLINEWIIMACSCETYKQSPYFQGLIENSMLRGMLYTDGGSETDSTHVLTKGCQYKDTLIFCRKVSNNDELNRDPSEY
jgi:hypothetical protein